VVLGEVHMALRNIGEIVHGNGLGRNSMIQTLGLE
jgi:hypothetical protein